MRLWLDKNFIEPLLRALVYEWQSESLVCNKNRIDFIKNYIQSTLRSQPFLMSAVIHLLSLSFLFFVRCASLHSFAQLDVARALCYIQMWRDSRWPGCAQLIQLFESLIALSMFALQDTDDEPK